MDLRLGFQQINFEFNCGGQKGLVTSTQKYNTAEWHTVTVVRNAGHGKLSVDSDRIGEVSVTCINPAVLTPPYYYGGLRRLTDAVNLQVRFINIKIVCTMHNANEIFIVINFLLRVSTSLSQAA